MNATAQNPKLEYNDTGSSEFGWMKTKSAGAIIVFQVFWQLNLAYTYLKTQHICMKMIVL